MLEFFYDATKEDKLTNIDTAYMYPSKGSEGITESILGRLITAEMKKRTFLATKVNPWVEGGLKPDNVKKQAAECLKGLQTDSVDLLYLHAPDHSVPIEDTMRAMQELYEEGKFKQLGLSNYAAWQVAEICEMSKKNNWVMPTVYQGMYNPLTRQVELELFPCLRHYGISFYAYNPLAGGLLSGKYGKVSDKPPPGTRFDMRKMYTNRYWKESYFNAVREIKEEVENYNKENNENIDMVSATLRWMVHHSKLDASKGDGIIIGQSKMDHLKKNMSGLKEDKLPEKIVDEFDKTWKKIPYVDVPNYLR